MYQHMPPTNPRKRAAPGGSPVQAPSMAQSYPASTQISQGDFLKWGQAPDSGAFPDSNGYNMNNYSAHDASQDLFDQTLNTPSTQLTRRPINRGQMVPAGKRLPYDNNADPWANLGEDISLDPQMDGTMEENDNIELLEEKAAVAKRDSQAKRKQIPPFVQKLSSFLDQSKNTELIRWSDRGDSFVVLDEDDFAKTLIPELFKHNNYASFVRQLNMYGFHKRVGLSDNSMKASERKNKSPSEYYNPYFKRGHPNLLWLINKPKGGGAKSKGRKVKNEDGQDAESDDDGRDIEEVYGNIQPMRAISAAPESGALQRRDVAVIQNQLSEIQKNQSSINNALNRLRKDHNQLYQQSLAFQTLHDRHENSINAILTFLATVYNRSLDGQGVPQNIAEMFANGIPNQQQHNGIGVNIEELSNQQQSNPGNMSPHRRPQRLLMAPQTGRAGTATPSDAPGTPRPHAHPRRGQAPNIVEEVFDSPADPLPSVSQSHSDAPHSMMSLINNTNAQSRPNNNSIAFPEMLSHYENSNGNSPLSAEQRDAMLSLMAQTSNAGTNSALVSPTPQAPSLEELRYTALEFDDLMKLQNENVVRLNDVKDQLVPPSPSGQIPGLDTDYFNTGEFDTTSNLDLDQYLNTDNFMNGSSPLGVGHGGYADYNNYGDGAMGDSHFDIGMDGTDADIKIETTDNSDAATPEGRLDTEDRPNSEAVRSPNKRRKRN